MTLYYEKVSIISHVTIFNISWQDLQFQSFQRIFKNSSKVHEVVLYPRNKVEKRGSVLFKTETKWANKTFNLFLPKTVSL